MAADATINIAEGITDFVNPDFNDPTSVGANFWTGVFDDAVYWSDVGRNFAEGIKSDITYAEVFWQGKATDAKDRLFDKYHEVKQWTLDLSGATHETTRQKMAKKAPLLVERQLETKTYIDNNTEIQTILPQKEKDFIDNGFGEYLRNLVQFQADSGRGAGTVLKKMTNRILASEYREEAKEYLANKLGMTGTRRKIWDEYDIVAMPGDRKAIGDAETKLIYSMLTAIPDGMREKVKGVITIISSWGLGGRTFKAGYGADGVIFMNDIFTHHSYQPFPGTTAEQRYVKVLFHETGHVLEFTDFLSEEQLKRRDDLWDASMGIEGSANFARDYGMKDKYEDLATMVGMYALNTRAIHDRAKGNVLDGKGDILLRKVELIADVYKHTNISGMIKTYTFRIDRAGKITKTEVPLIEQEIGGKKYWLPLFDEKDKVSNRMQEPVLEGAFQIRR